MKEYFTAKKTLPILAGLAAGLYPVLFYYSRNFERAKSWDHVFHFVLFYIIFPVIVFTIVYRIFKIKSLVRYSKFVLPFLNITVFLYFLKTFTFVHPERKIMVGILVVAVLFSYFLNKHFKKLLAFQFILAAIGLFNVLQLIYEKITYDDSWLQQPDAIEEVVFKKKPNVYFIEPDGYVSFSELKSDFYNVENSEFEGFLKQNNFKTYPDFRTNYKSTLASNSAAFSMKHHYHNFDADFEEVENARQIIISDNPVLNAFKNNGYETYFLSEKKYLLLNRPELGYHHSNIDYDDIQYLHNDMGPDELIVEPFSDYLNDGIDKPKFFFVEILKPWHIRTGKGNESGPEVVASERQKYIDRLRESNAMMTEMIQNILKKDPGALIMIMADHGGFVGLEYTRQANIKTQDPEIINSVFSANLTIHWPNNEIPSYDTELQSPVNVFRILLSYLSENETYLEHLQPDESFVAIQEGAPKGIYKYINDAREIVFEKQEPKNK